MEFSVHLTGTMFWAALFSTVFFVVCLMFIANLAKKKPRLKPVGGGLNLIALFLAIQAYIFFGAEYHPRFTQHLNFISWILFTFGALKLLLYVYGDLFVVKLKHGSFPAAFKNTITVAVIAIVALVLLKEILDINVTSLIAATTVLTATIGLAFQSTLANMLAGLTIHMEKPLKQGDWVSVGGHEGRVVDITLRSTRIVTVEHNEVFIPNSKILNDAVVNYSLPDSVQVRKLTVSVAYTIPPNTVKATVLNALATITGVSRSPEPIVRVVSYGEYSVHYEIRYAITDFSRFVEIEAEIMSLLWYWFKRDNITIPMPTRDVFIHEKTAEMDQSDKERLAAEIFSLLSKVEVLAPLNKTELKKLSAQLSVKSYAANEVPIHQGERGNSFYIIKSGKVDVIVEKAQGESAVVATLGPGNFFGEMSLLTGAQTFATIRIKEDAECVVIDKEQFGTILANNPSIAEALSNFLSERQAGLEMELEKLDAASLARRKRDVSGKMLTKIREFFGLAGA